MKNALMPDVVHYLDAASLALMFNKLLEQWNVDSTPDINAYGPNIIYI